MTAMSHMHYLILYILRLFVLGRQTFIHFLNFLFTRQTRMQGTKAKRYKNTLDCFTQIIKNEGIASLYAGVVPRLGRVVPGQGIIFMSFETIQKTLEKNFAFFQSSS